MRQTHGSPLLFLFLVGMVVSLCTVELPRFSSSSFAAASFVASSNGSAAAQEAGGGGEVTKANWQQHPKIKAIRAIVQSVKTGMSGKSLTSKKRTFAYCEPYEDTVRLIATDSQNRTRFYQSEGGSEDSSLKFEHYYDESGRLRFVFITGGAVNGSVLEHRIYFDETGKRIWEEQTIKKGPGYTWPSVWPDEQLRINDAAEKFSARSACPEVKTGRGKRN